ncbi:lipase member H-like isoform X2 [Plodia interpunctella]|uniref:lipase member H-like isoform X2 n=1 Tax=Plodia interpunctella TaxID=58824 RepID=UPI0023688A9E|nr:lipase member H-like isoform X2 [Plodia interpunctella]
MLSMLYLMCAPIIFESVTSMYSNKALEGYPSGYLAECPGSTKPAIITNKSLKYLTITVSGANPNVPQMRKKYNYFQMKEMSKDPTMDYSKRTMLYVGGFLDSPNFPFARTIEIYYKRLGFNVWLLDVNRFTTMEYPAAARFTRTVGKHTAEMLANLTSTTALNPKKLDILGLSLGGQTMSFIAKYYTALTGLKLSRLTALDPSGPCFRTLGPEDRLDLNDADLVDVVSTNIDGFGMATPVGHVNFYVNGGEYQPGDIFWMPCNVLCSHIRSYTIWLAALDNPDSFLAVRCDSVQDARDNKCYDKEPMVTNVMGLKVDRNKPGIFYLPTNNNFPYYLGVGGLKKRSDYFSAKLNSINAKDVMKM